jgi:hypothetical protein
MEASVQGTARHVRLSRSCHRLLRCRWATRAAPDGGIYAGSTYSVSLVRADVASRHELEISVRDSDARCTVGAWGGGMDSAGGHLRVHRCAGRCAAAVRPPVRHWPRRCLVRCLSLPAAVPPAACLAARGPSLMASHSPPLAATRRRSLPLSAHAPAPAFAHATRTPRITHRCEPAVPGRLHYARIEPALSVPRHPHTPCAPAAHTAFTRCRPAAGCSRIAPPYRLLPSRLPSRLCRCHS